MNINELYVGKRVEVDGDSGTVVHIGETDFYTASIPSIHTIEKTFSIHFDDSSVCVFRGQDDIDTYQITAI